MADPIEQIMRDAFDRKGINYTDDQNPQNMGLDFYLPEHDLHIEVKQFHSDRIAAQMSRVLNVIAVQGRQAAEYLAALAEAGAQSGTRTLGDLIQDARSLADWYDLQHDDKEMAKYLRDVADNLASEPSKVIRTSACNSPKESE